MIAAIFVVPLVYLINAFFMGRVIKRFKISSNNCFNTIIGFFALLVITYIVSSWLYVGRVSILIYAIVLGVIQGFLIAAYIANWRYIFLNINLQWKKILFFVLGAGLTILISYLCFRDFNSEFGKNWLPTIQNITLDLRSSIWFGTTEQDVISNFCANNILNVFWIQIFRIKNDVEINMFCNWSWTICAGIIVGCLVQWISNNFNSIPRLIFALLITLFNVILTLAFIESYAVPEAWLMLELMIFILVLLQDKSYGRFKLAFLTILMLSMLATAESSFFLVIALWLYTIYWAIRNKENSINYILCLGWPLFLAIFSLLSIYTYWLLGLMQAVYLVFMIIIVSVFYKMGTPAWETKLARGISTHSGKIVYAFLGVIIALILVANFFIFHEVYHWDPANIDYKYFLTFIYQYIWTFNIDTGLSIAIINSVLYTFFAGIIIAFIILRKVKKLKLHTLTKTDSAIKLSFITALLFCNPLVIHILKKSNNLTLNTTNLNMFLAIPIIVFLLEVNGNAKVNPLEKWAYNWY